MRFGGAVIRERFLLSAQSAQPHFLQGNDAARAVCTKGAPSKRLCDGVALSHLTNHVLHLLQGRDLRQAKWLWLRDSDSCLFQMLGLDFARAGVLVNKERLRISRVTRRLERLSQRPHHDSRLGGHPLLSFDLAQA